MITLAGLPQSCRYNGSAPMNATLAMSFKKKGKK